MDRGGKETDMIQIPEELKESYLVDRLIFFFFSRSKTSIFVTMIFISWCDGKKMMVTGIEEFFWLIDDEFCNNFI